MSFTRHFFSAARGGPNVGRELQRPLFFESGCWGGESEILPKFTVGVLS